MKSGIVKIVSGIFLLSLIVTIFMPRDSFGYIIFLGAFAFLVSILLAQIIKRIQKSKLSRIGSILLMNLILFSLIQLVHSLSNVGMGDHGFAGLFVDIINLTILVIAVIVGIVLVLRNKNQDYEKSLNKMLSIVLVVILIVFFYNPIIMGLAEVTNAQGFCGFHLELRENSMTFGGGYIDYCLTDIAVEKNNPNICISDECITQIAYVNEDISTCNYAEYYVDCVDFAVFKLMENPQKVAPEDCDVLTKTEAKEHCLMRLAFALDDANYCLDVSDFGNCYDQLADVQMNDDESQCNPIRNTEARATCMGYVHATVLVPSGIGDATE